MSAKNANGTNTQTQDPAGEPTETNLNPSTPEGDAGSPAPQPVSAADIKKVPWVQDLIKAAGELGALKKQIADDKAKKEQEALIAKGDFDTALKAEQAKYQALETTHKATIRKMELTNAFTSAGLTDPRAVILFETEQKEGEDVTAFVDRIKSDARNALYFGAAKPARTPGTPPPTAQTGGSVFTDTAQAKKVLETAKDPKVRTAAAEYLRAEWEKANP